LYSCESKGILTSVCSKILKQDNFPHLLDPNNAPQRTAGLLNLDFESEKYRAVKSDNESATMDSEDVFSPCTSDEDEQEHDDKGKDTNATMTRGGPQRGVIAAKCEQGGEDEENEKEAPRSTNKDMHHNPYGDEDTFLVRIPVPGLRMGGSCLLDPTSSPRLEDNGDREMRLTPALCTICLSNYKVCYVLTVHCILHGRYT
jgi:hypothetical protein